MKKSLIAMALMFGAVVFVASSCGGGGGDEECTKCTVKYTNAQGAKVASSVHTDQPCKDGWATPGKPTGADLTAGADKTIDYVCE